MKKVGKFTPRDLRDEFVEIFPGWIESTKELYESEKEFYNHIEWKRIEYGLGLGHIFWYKVLRRNNLISFYQNKNSMFKFIVCDIDYFDILDYVPEIYDLRQASLFDQFKLDDYFNPRPLDDFFME